MVRRMKKEVKTVLKSLKKYANPVSSFVVVQRNHIRVTFQMINDFGERVTIKTTLGVSPRDTSWTDSFKKQMTKKFAKLNISQEFAYI